MTMQSALVLSEALSQFIANVADVDECDRDPREVAAVALAQEMLDEADAVIAAAAN